MKKIATLSVIILALVATIAWAASIPIFGTDPAYSQNFTLVSTTSTTGAASVVQLGRPYTKYTCIASATTSTSPGVVNIQIHAGITSNTTNLISQATYSAATLPASIVSIHTGTAMSFSYIRGTYVSSVTNTTSPLRVDCITTN